LQFVKNNKEIKPLITGPQPAMRSLNGSKQQPDRPNEFGKGNIEQVKHALRLSGTLGAFFEYDEHST